ncbi:hypothetical protein CASFOL_034746 [Castilleja foliolosa]|uniref:NECAP PHear domain-containing protein n=1 Tax=Castilleja foliolosa TaxID=1961234 RepID=A0ABD3BRN0_9LAMI
MLGFSERNEAFDFNVALSDHEKYVKREVEKEVGSGEGGEDGHIDIHPAVHHRLKEGETIRINVKNKPSSGAGMLSAAGKSKPLGLSPQPTAATKIRSPLPPPPNDAAAARMTSPNHSIAVNKVKDNSSNSSDNLSDLSQLKGRDPFFVYKARLEEATASTPDPTSIDPDALFYDVAKTKNGAFGTGSFGSTVMSKISAGSSSSTSTQQQMEAMREELRELEEQRAADRERMERLDMERAADAEKVLKMQQEMDRMQEMIRQFVQSGGLPPTQ